MLDVADNYLRAAIAEEQRAQEAYAPYWRRGRMRYIVKPKAKKAKAEKSNYFFAMPDRVAGCFFAADCFFAAGCFSAVRCFFFADCVF